MNAALSPTQYSPDRSLMPMVVGMLIGVGILGLWKGFAHELRTGRVFDPPVVATGVAPVSARALPAVAATTDTLIPPEAHPVPPLRAAAAAPPTAAALPAEPLVVVETAPAAPEPQPAPMEKIFEDETAPPPEPEPYPDEGQPNA